MWEGPGKLKPRFLLTLRTHLAQMTQRQRADPNDLSLSIPLSVTLPGLLERPQSLWAGLLGDMENKQTDPFMGLSPFSLSFPLLCRCSRF